MKTAIHHLTDVTTSVTNHKQRAAKDARPGRHLVTPMINCFLTAAYITLETTVAIPRIGTEDSGAGRKTGTGTTAPYLIVVSHSPHDIIVNCCRNVILFYVLNWLTEYVSCLYAYEYR